MRKKAQETIREMGYFVTKIAVKKGRKSADNKGRTARSGALPSAASAAAI